jgi:hypothetical protein
MEKKIIDYIKSSNPDFVSAQEYIDSGVPINLIPTNTGIFNSSLPKPQFGYTPPPGASKTAQVRDSYIVMGQVPHGGDTTGYGSLGTPADSIDLVVGRLSSARGGAGPEPGSVVDNNFAADAARIYISKLCDIDQSFGLASHTSKNEGRGLIGRSGIGIKADGVRIVGREGVKITTGKMVDATGFGSRGETNSLGGNIGIAPQIELVAGNNYSNVQGVALGKTVVECLNELSDIVGEIWSGLFRLSLAQAGYNTTLGIAPLKPWVGVSALNTNRKIYGKVVAPLFQTRLNMALWRMNYLLPIGNSYIESANVKTN